MKDTVKILGLMRAQLGLAESDRLWCLKDRWSCGRIHRASLQITPLSREAPREMVLRDVKRQSRHPLVVCSGLH